MPFPAKYSEETSSDLTAVVKPGDNDLEPFKLDQVTEAVAIKCSRYELRAQPMPGGRRIREDLSSDFLPDALCLTIFHGESVP